MQIILEVVKVVSQMSPEQLVPLVSLGAIALAGFAIYVVHHGRRDQ